MRIASHRAHAYISGTPKLWLSTSSRLTVSCSAKIPQAARNDLQELQRKKAALSLELMSLEDASRNRKQGTRGAGAIPANTEARVLASCELG